MSPLIERNESLTNLQIVRSIKQTINNSFIQRSCIGRFTTTNLCTAKLLAASSLATHSIPFPFYRNAEVKNGFSFET